MKISKKMSARTIIGLAIATSFMMSGCADPGSTANTTENANETTESSTARIDRNQTAAKLVPQKYRDGGEITAGAIAGMAPMMFVGQDGETIVGAEADVLSAVGEVLGIEVNLKETKPDAFMTGMLAGRFEVAAGSITDTKKREEQVDFVSYAEYGQALITQVENADKISFDSLCGKEVGVLKGSIQQMQFLPEISNDCEKAGKPKPVAQAFPDGAALFLAASSGRIDAGFLNEVSVLYQASQSGGELKMADSGFGTDPKGIVVGKNTGLGKAILAAVEVLEEEGVLATIFDEWGIKSTILPEPKMNIAQR